MRRLLALLVLALVVAGCGAGEGIRDEGGQAVVSPIANAGGGQRAIFVYVLRYGQLVKVQRTVPGAQAPEREALLALLDGPNDREQTQRFTSAIPPRTTLASLQVANGSASVDLIALDDNGILRTATSDDVDARQRQLMLKQIVYTLTEFPDIDNVEVRLNGESVPLGKQFPGATLTRRFFDDAKVAAPHDQTRCGGNTEPTGKGKALRVPEVGGRRQLRRVQGRDDREARQDHRPAVAGQPPAALAGGRRRALQPAHRGRHRPVRAVRRPARDSVGRDGRRRIQGHAAVRRRR